MEQDPEIRKELSEIGRRGAFLRKAIAGRKAEIERINRNLDNLPAPVHHLDLASLSKSAKSPSTLIDGAGDVGQPASPNHFVPLG
jgi:hypothetical protein